MQWFKHYSTAEISDHLSDLLENFNFEGYGRYWRLLEILSNRFKGEEVCFRFHSRLLRDSLRFRSDVQLGKFLLAIGLQPGFNVKINGKQIEIEAPILLDLQDRDFKKSRKLREETAPKNKIKNKIKNKNKDIDKEIRVKKKTVKESRVKIVSNDSADEPQIDCIIEKWNECAQKKKVTGSKAQRATIKKKISKCSFYYSGTEVLQAIENYHRVLNDPNCFFSHPWALVDFIGRETAEKFYPDNFDYLSFVSKSSAQQKQDSMLDLVSKYEGDAA